MKLLLCPTCGMMVMLMPGQVSGCACRQHAGKYCEDKVTAVVTKGAIVVGIDNNSWNTAVRSYTATKDWEDRIDFYFTGWIPNKPGEVLYKKTVEQVAKFKLPKKKWTTTSTIPTKYGK